MAPGGTSPPGYSVTAFDEIPSWSNEEIGKVVNSVCPALKCSKIVGINGENSYELLSFEVPCIAGIYPGSISWHFVSRLLFAGLSVHLSVEVSDV